MPDSNIHGPELLKTVLQPLLEDFQYWFGRSRHIAGFMSKEEQSDLLLRVKQAQEEVNTAKMLFSATDGKVGQEIATLMPRHKLVTECTECSNAQPLTARRLLSELPPIRTGSFSAEA